MMGFLDRFPLTKKVVCFQPCLHYNRKWNTPHIELDPANKALLDINGVWRTEVNANKCSFSLCY